MPVSDAFPQLEPPASLTVLVYEAIRAAITGRKLPAGSKLSVPDLAAQLKVSRTPVREALARLEREGLVTTILNRGSFVSFLGADDVREVYQVREVLEGLVARLAAQRVTAAAILTLTELVRTQQEALRAGDREAIMKVDMEFHRHLRDLAGNRRLSVLLQNLQDQIRIVFATSIIIPGRREKAIREHREILSAIEKEDPEAAEGAAREHIRNVREAVLASLEPGHPGKPAKRRDHEDR